MILNSTTEIRKRIARSYFRDVVWIDDEIRPSAVDQSTRTPFLEFFQPIANQFARQEIICHLKEFPQIEGEVDPYAPLDEVDVCEKLALKADMVVLDWHLGNQTPKYSANMIRKIAAEGGSRFIVILSQSNHLVEEFESELGDIFEKLTTVCYKAGDGVFALLFAKSDFSERNGATQLVDAIFAHMALTYPDYLHWTAIELAGKIKAHSPRWLSSIPANTDLAVLSENLHSAEGISEAIIENLLEDLGEVLDFSSIESIQPSALRCEDWPKGESYKEQLLAEIAGVDRGLLDNIQKVVPLAVAAQKSLDPKTKILAKVLKNVESYPALKTFGESIKALGEFCETRSSSSEVRVMRGSVLRKIDESKDEILVCVSQSCDCQRETSLLFMGAVTVGDDHEGRPGETFFRFKEKTYLVASTASNLRVLDVSLEVRIPKGYKVVGRLREIALYRIIGRFWGQATRVGINQPRFTRETRRERA